MTTQTLSEAGQKLADALVKAGVYHVRPTDWLVPLLNTAAALLFTPPGGEGAGLRVVFDGPPGPTSCCFVEVEDDNGKSVNVGPWRERNDGFWELRIATPKPPAGQLLCKNCEELVLPLIASTGGQAADGAELSAVEIAKAVTACGGIENGRFTGNGLEILNNALDLARSCAALASPQPAGTGDLETELLWPVGEEMERLEADLRNVGDELSVTQGDAASYLALAQGRIRSVMDLVEAVSRAPRADAPETEGPREALAAPTGPTKRCFVYCGDGICTCQDRGLSAAERAAIGSTLASPQPAVQGPVAAGVGEIERPIRVAMQNEMLSDGRHDRVEHRTKVAAETARAILAALTPADPKTPDAGVGNAALREALKQLHKRQLGPNPFNRLVTLEQQMLQLISNYERGYSECFSRDILVAWVGDVVSALAPQPPKAETPAGVGDDGEAAYRLGKEEGAAEAIQRVAERIGIDSEYRWSSDPDRRQGGPVELLERIVEHAAALSTAPAARPGDGVGLTLREAFSCADAEDWRRLNGFLDDSGHGRFWKAIFAQIRALAAAPAADGGRA